MDKQNCRKGSKQEREEHRTHEMVSLGGGRQDMD